MDIKEGRKSGKPWKKKLETKTAGMWERKGVRLIFKAALGDEKWELQNARWKSAHPFWPVPLLQNPDFTLPQLLLTLWWDSMWENQHLPFSGSLCLSSHCLMALEPAMLPWEPAGDSRYPLHLFSFISFWKGIKCFSFSVAWKICSNSKGLKFAHSGNLV